MWEFEEWAGDKQDSTEEESDWQGELDRNEALGSSGVHVGHLVSELVQY